MYILVSKKISRAIRFSAKTTTNTTISTNKYVKKINKKNRWDRL